MAQDAKVYVRLRLNADDFAKKLKLTEEQMKTYSQLMAKLARQGERDWNRHARAGRGFASSMEQAIRRATASMAGWTALVAGAGAALRDAMATTMEFERSLSGLSALTGTTGEDLEYLRSQAIELSAQSELSARDVVEAMKFIGGQRPELLEAASGLVAVTDAVITLSEASEGSMEDSARAVTGALGQFGKGAEYAASFVNVLAAGAKEGAAEIPYLQQAVEKSGSAASAAGLTFEQLVAVIEGVAPRFTKAEEAGTSLRAVLTKLEGQTDDRLKPSVVGLHRALDNLAAREMSTAELTKMFGLENINMARALLEARGNIERLETAVTGTHVAEEQAAVQTQNLTGAVRELSNAWDAFVLSLNRSDGALAGAVRWVTKLVNGMNDIFSTRAGLDAAGTDKLASAEITRANERLVEYQNRRYTREQAITREISYQEQVYGKLVGQMRAFEKYVNAQPKRDSNGATRTARLWGWYKNGGKRPASDAIAEWDKYLPSSATGVVTLGRYDELKKQAEAARRTISYLRQLASAGVVRDNGSGGANGPDGKPQAPRQELKARLEMLRLLSTAEQQWRSQRYEAELAATRGLISEEQRLRMEAAATTLQQDLYLSDEQRRRAREATAEYYGQMQQMAGGIAGLLSQIGAGWAQTAAQVIQSGLQIVQTVLQITQAIQAMNAARQAASLLGGGLLGALFGFERGGVVPQGYAAGGLIRGPRSTGDHLLARVNAGEMVLTRTDQSRLVAAIRGGAGSGEGKARLRGEDLYLPLSAFMRRTGKKL